MEYKGIKEIMKEICLYTGAYIFAALLHEKLPGICFN